MGKPLTFAGKEQNALSEDGIKVGRKRIRDKTSLLTIA